MKPEINQPYCFLLPTCKGGFFLNTENIIRVQALSNYCKLFFTDGTTLVVAKVLKWFEEKLPTVEFIRIHRSHLINREQLLAISKTDNSAKLTLRNGEVMQVSRRKKEWVLSNMDIKVADLPATVLAYVKEHYKGKTVKEGLKLPKLM